MYILKSRIPRSDTGSNISSATDQKPIKADADSCYEVFRNNTTAVEVVVKEVHSKTKNSNRHAEAQTNNRTNTTKMMETEIANLRLELAKSNADLIKTKKGFKCIVVEMKKLLDTVNSQELDRQKENLTLQLEIEKLKTLLDFKSNVINRFKKELNIMKRLLKCAMKNMSIVPQMENVSVSSDTEYEDFDKEINKKCHVKIATKIFDSMGTTLDSSTMKSARDPCENK